MRVQALGWEDALEEEMTAHSRILAWKIPWREEPGGLSGALWGRSELDTTEYTASFLSPILKGKNSIIHYKYDAGYSFF